MARYSPDVHQRSAPATVSRALRACTRCVPLGGRKESGGLRPSPAGWWAYEVILGAYSPLSIAAVGPLSRSG